MFCGSLVLSDTFIRSATDFTLCLSIRHLAVRVLIGTMFSSIWYHAGSSLRCWMLSFIAARFVLCSFATLSILLISSFRYFMRGPLVGVFQHCRKGFFLACVIVFVGAAVSIIRSVTATHGWHLGEKSRYIFNHIRSIASFLAPMSRIFRPPISLGWFRKFRAIRGPLPSSHMK